MTLALAIETSNPSAACGAGVALGEINDDGVRTIDAESVQKADRHSDDLMPAIDRLMRRTSAAPEDLERICVSVGPGGYTGLRIAVVVAQSIAECAGASCVGVPTECAVARRVPPGESFAVCLASKGSTVFARPFDADGRPTADGSLVDVERLAAMGVKRIVADAFLPDQIREAWPGQIIAPSFDPIAVLEHGAGMPGTDPVHLRVAYPREPDAVTQWRRLHGGA